MRLQDRLAELLRELKLESPPGPGEPAYDVAFFKGGVVYVVEVKTGAPASAHQVRLGCGQVLEYCHVLRRSRERDVRPVLLLEEQPPEPWPALAGELGVGVVAGRDLRRSLQRLTGG